MNIHSIAYNLFFIPIATIIKWIWAFFNPKLREREQNWKSSIEALNIIENQLEDERNYVVWFHSASMGEFEQAKPVIENIKHSCENAVVVCSFFSPSGYNNQKNYSFADAVVYLPFDTRRNAKRFLEIAKPDFAVFVRYELWRNYLELLKVKNTPRILINATFPRSKLLNFFKGFLLSTLDLFDEIYTINDKQTELFNKLKVKANVITLADTRFDRIISKIESAKLNPIPSFELFGKDEFVLVAGSTWEPDEKLIANALNLLNLDNIQIRLIIVPHEPTPQNVNRIQKLFQSNLLLSNLENISKNNPNENLEAVANRKVIIVDSIGKLLGLYRYASSAYIGGAFGEGVHSVTEPAGYGIPLFSGIGIQSSPDAMELTSIGCLRTVRNGEELCKLLKIIINNPQERAQLGNLAREYIYSRKGASTTVSNRILERAKK